MRSSLYSYKDVEEAGNAIMPFYRTHIFAKVKLSTAAIVKTHGVDAQQHMKVGERMDKAIGLPPIVVDRGNTIIDGNHRLQVSKERGKETIVAFKSVGEFYDEEFIP